MMFKRYGLDHYQIHLKEIQLLKRCQKNNVYIYNAKEKQEDTFFSVRFKDRIKVKEVFPNAILLYTSGIVGMLYRNFSNKTRIVSYVICVIAWILMSSTIFKIEIVGPKDELDIKLKNSLASHMYQRKDVKNIKKQLLKDYHEEFSWLEVYDKGSIIKVRYANKEEITQSKFANLPLVAKKDGMIAYFKSDAGFKVRQVNDVVKKGDILIDNHMLDSFNRDHEVEVRGRVYAYTWQKIIVEMKENKIPNAINYFSLLLESRNQIHIDLDKEEKVVKENVLQFTKNKGKIKLEILYTLLEDITS